MTKKFFTSNKNAKQTQRSLIRTPFLLQNLINACKYEAALAILC
mgnify:CR=1 FL=1